MRCDEFIKRREGSADERYEYCGIAEIVSPLNKMIAFTGEFELADRIEKMTFNAGQGARFPVLTGLSYLTADNRIHINHRELVKRESYDAAHVAAACCALNGARLMPYYVEGMWMQSPGSDTIAAVLYGPGKFTTRVAETPVTIVEDTQYPFSDQIVFDMQPGQPVPFTFVIRKPFGCKKFTLKTPVNAKIDEGDRQIAISHRWEKGDRVEIRFHFEIEKVPQPASKTVKNGGVYLSRGPLVYALSFEHRVKTAKEHNNSGYYRYKVKPTDKTGWKYTLTGNESFRFVSNEEDDATGNPWEDPVVFLEGQMMDEKNKPVDVKLVPMGNTVFRRVTFPVSTNQKNMEK